MSRKYFGMTEKKLKVYCETSFWSYLNGHPAPLQHIAVKKDCRRPVIITLFVRLPIARVAPAVV